MLSWPSPITPTIEQGVILLVLLIVWGSLVLLGLWATRAGHRWLAWGMVVPAFLAFGALAFKGATCFLAFPSGPFAFGPEPSEILALVLGLLSVNAFAVAVIWAGLGRTHWFLRMLLVGALIGLTLPIPAYELTLLFFTQGAGALVPLVLIRTFRRAPASMENGGEGAQAYHVRRKFQFTLLDLLLLTVLVAAVVAVAASIPVKVWTTWPEDPFSAPLPPSPEPWVVYGAWGLLFALTTLMAAIAVLSRLPWWLRLMSAVLALPMCIAMLGLALARQAGRRPTVADSSGQTSARVVLRRRAARLSLALLSLAVLLPLAAIYFALFNPPPIPQTVLPDTNGYDVISKAGAALANIDAPGTSYPGAAAFAAANRKLLQLQHGTLEQVHVALDGPCQVPLSYNMSDASLATFQNLRNMARIMIAEASLAAREDRTEDAIQGFCDMVRLGRASARGGLFTHFLGGAGVEAMGLDGLHDLSKTLNPSQCRTVIALLSKHDSNREPLEQFYARDLAWVARAPSWRGRVVAAIQRLIGEDTVRQLSEKGRKRTQGHLRVLLTELALRAYLVEQGKYPDRLVNLVPKYLAAVPKDPFTGEPLVYELDEKGYLLYSSSIASASNAFPRAIPPGPSPPEDVVSEKDSVLEIPPDAPGMQGMAELPPD